MRTISGRGEEAPIKVQVHKGMTISEFEKVFVQTCNEKTRRQHAKKGKQVEDKQLLTVGELLFEDSSGKPLKSNDVVAKRVQQKGDECEGYCIIAP